MRFRFPTHRKDAPLRAWPFVGFTVALFALAAWGVSHLPARWLPPCGFHTLTGHPCPSCGGTRTVRLLLTGRLADGIAMNPLIALVLLGLVLWFLVGLAARLLGRDFSIEVGEREATWLWLALLAAFLVNWVYLWHAGV